jgi:hypothetical protein
MNMGLRRAFAAGLLAGHAALAHAGSFALIGDMPYSDAEVPVFRAILDDIGRDEGIAFVVHAGDIKSGSETCDDARFAARLADFEASRHPIVLVPGDNEWTDCHRANNGAFDPLERLAKLRAMFASGSESLGRRRMPLTRQGDVDPSHAAWRENVRWTFEGVLVAGLNIPGSNNNWKPRGDNAEFEARLSANTAWLAAAFAQARAQDARAVMLVLQANPDFEGTEAKKRAGRPGFRDGYAEFRAQLAREALRFGRPVLVVHGDTHSFRVDQPLIDETGARVPNVTRLETFGSPGLGWVKVSVEPKDTAVFRIQPQRWVPRADLRPQ